MSVAELLDARYRCTKQGRAALERLTQAFLFDEQWQASRLAIAYSLRLEDDPPMDGLDREGTEILGRTLLGRDGIGNALTAMVVQRAGRQLTEPEIIRLIEAHWSRGLERLIGELEATLERQEDADALLLHLAEDSLLGEGEPEGEPRDETLLEERVVGQDAAKRVVTRLLRDALGQQPHRLGETLLFTGPASTGKTLFSRTIADILELPFVDLNGTTLWSEEELIERIDLAISEDGQTAIQTGTRGGLPVLKYPPVVIFIDECHQLPRRVQDALLTATEPSQREAKTGDLFADLTDATFLLATTDSHRLVDPLRTRSREVKLEPYSRDEISEIIRRAHPALPPTVRNLLAVAGRLVPRQALMHAKDFERFMRQDHPSARASEQLALAYMRERELDPLGLGPRDYRYLEVLSESTSSTGLRTLANKLGAEEAEVSDVIEPFLLQLKLVELTPSGRRLTIEGRQRLNDHRRATSAQ